MFETMKQQDVIIPFHQNGPEMCKPVTLPNTYDGGLGSQIVQSQMGPYNPQDLYELQMEASKAEIRENVKLEAWRKKRILKEEEEERRRGLYEDIEVTPEGKIQAITRNLSVVAEPRSIINMQKPAVTILKRLADTTEQIYLLECISGNQVKRIFLDKENAGSGSYLVKKLGSEGICFKTNEVAKTKGLALQLLAVLLAASAGEEFLPDVSGYYEMPDGSLQYVEEGGLTWNTAKKQSK